MPAAPEFVLLSCNFSDLQLHEELRPPNITPDKVSNVLKRAFDAARMKVHDFAPIDKQGIRALAEAHSGKIKSAGDLAAVLQQLKPSQLEATLQPYCREDRKPDRIIEKKLPPLTDFAVSCYFSGLFEKLHPIRLKPSGKPPQKEFRFAANYGGWVLVRKVHLDAAERKEVMGCLVATMESTGRKASALPEYSQYAPGLEALLSKYPQRKSFAKLPLALEEAQAAGLFQVKDEFFPKYALYGIMAHFGYSPYLTSSQVGEAYPELKIPKPRGRLKKD